MINEYYAKKFCKEDISKIKNYDEAIADTTQVWDCHHMTETWWNCSKQELIDNECYYNRKACELIFLTHAEHTRLHMQNISEYTRQKMSESHKGEKNPFYGKHHTEDNKRKISESHKGKRHTDDTRKKMSESRKGKKFSEETRRKMSEAAKHRTDETRRKMGEANKGKTWKVIDGKRVWLAKEV